MIGSFDHDAYTKTFQLRRSATYLTFAGDIVGFGLDGEAAGAGRDGELCPANGADLCNLRCSFCGSWIRGDGTLCVF